ncbi:hypothetical protein BGZ92_001284 [Podila epicladia]|nr:hypothetical protein BGZ92_001284 [Podila epicladia]
MTNTQDMQDTQAIKAMGPYLVKENPPHYLSAVEMSDVPEFTRIANINKDIYNGSATFQFPFLEAHAQSRIKKSIANRTATGVNLLWAVRASPTGPMIGWVHAYFRDANELEVHPKTGAPLKIAEIGYGVSPECTGKGYGGRSARFVVQEILFKEMGCDIVRGESYVENIGSRRILETSGMKCEVEENTVFIPKLQQDRLTCWYSGYKDAEVEAAMDKAQPIKNKINNVAHYQAD